jgi:hypothetical protein
MNDSLVKAGQFMHSLAARFFFCLGLLGYSIFAHAVSGTFQGLLVPDSFDPPIPIMIEVKEAYGIFSGRFKTSSPLTGEGPITSGEKRGQTCNMTSHIGNGIRMRFEGQCTPASLEGRYRIYFPDGRVVVGKSRLNLLKLDNDRKKNDAESTFGRSLAEINTACLRANSACLAACPRGVQSDEFICANGCTRRLTNCKAKGKQSLDSSPAALY